MASGIGLGMVRSGIVCGRWRHAVHGSFTRKNGTDRHRGAHFCVRCAPPAHRWGIYMQRSPVMRKYTCCRLSIVVTTCAAQFRGRTRWDCPPVLSPNPTPALLPHAHCFRTSHANLHMVRLLRMRARLGTAASLPRQYGPTVRECRRRACAVADIAWRAHKDRSGFDGAWTADPLKFDRAWVPFCSAPPWAYLRRAESVGSR